MKTLILKEVQAPYLIDGKRSVSTPVKGKRSVSYTLTLDEAVLAEGPVRVLHSDGERVVGIIVPATEYAAFRAWRETQQRRQQAQQNHDTFEREVAAFERMLPQLLQEHRGRVVAIHEGQVVEVGDSKEKVSERVHQRLGDITVYIQWVLERPRIYKFPYFRVIR